MKHEKKHKKKKLPKSSKKSKKSDRKEKKQKYKEKKKRDKKLKDSSKATYELAEKRAAAEKTNQCSQIDPTNETDVYCGPPIDLMNRAKCPETKAEYDHRQNQMKRVLDPETGRIRLIKGDGEIIEEIVTRDRHKKINQEATQSDGRTFQKNTSGPLRK